MKKILIALYLAILFTSCREKPYCEDTALVGAYKEGDTINFHKLNTKEYSSLAVDTVFIVTKSIHHVNTVGKRKEGDYCENVHEYTIRALDNTGNENLIYNFDYRIQDVRGKRWSTFTEFLSEIKTNNNFILKELDYVSYFYEVLIDSVNYHCVSAFTEHTNINKGYVIDSVLFHPGQTNFGLFGYHVKDNNSWYYVK